MSNPYEIRTWKCAICSTIKQEANGWIIHVWGTDCDPLFGDAYQAGKPFLITLPFKEALMKVPNAKPLCGPGCANKDHQAFMESMK